MKLQSVYKKEVIEVIIDPLAGEFEKIYGAYNPKKVFEFMVIERLKKAGIPIKADASGFKGVECGELTMEECIESNKIRYTWRDEE